MEWTSRLAEIDSGAHFFFDKMLRNNWLAHYLGWLDPLMLNWVTRAGDRDVLIVVALVAVLVFLALKKPWTAGAIILSGCLGLGISESVKKLVNRERPPDVTNPAVGKPHSPSFPSGHALGSTAIFGAIGLGWSRRLRSRHARRFVIALGFFLPFLIGLSRLYLGVHFLFDVVGGWTAGTACVLLGHWVDRSFAPDATESTLPLRIAFAVLFFLFTFPLSGYYLPS